MLKSDSVQVERTGAKLSCTPYTGDTNAKEEEMSKGGQRVQISSYKMNDFLPI